MEKTWLDNVLDSALDALWADSARDPADICMDRESETIRDFGHNLVGRAA